MMYAKMLLLLVVSVITVTTIMAQFTRKSGDCPPYPDVGVCDMTCFADNHCKGIQKCCRTACGGTFCTNPVTKRRAQDEEKPGYCPNPPSGPWVCSSRCVVDGDCRGTKKCCKNRCGAMACTKAVTYSEELDNEI